MKTLIVEDDFTCRIMLQKKIAKYGETHIAINGKEAIEGFKIALDENEPYNLICLDIMMPEMNGQEVLEEVRKIEKEREIGGLDGVKVIMTTASKDPKDVLKSFRSQCEAYLVKPIEKKKLDEELHKLNLISTN